MLNLIKSFRFGDLEFQEYHCDHAGDELGLHDHTYNHLTKVTNGEIEVFTDDGVKIRSKAGDDPLEYRAGRKHGIRAVTDGAMFLNISPIMRA